MNSLSFVSMLLLCCASLSAQTVYKNPKGYFYHDENCILLNRINEKLSVNQAIKNGYAPCKNCNAPKKPLIITSNKNKKKTTKGKNLSLAPEHCCKLYSDGSKCNKVTTAANKNCHDHTLCK